MAGRQKDQEYNYRLHPLYLYFHHTTSGNIKQNNVSIIQFLVILNKKISILKLKRLWSHTHIVIIWLGILQLNTEITCAPQGYCWPFIGFDNKLKIWRASWLSATVNVFLISCFIITIEYPHLENSMGNSMRNIMRARYCMSMLNWWHCVFCVSLGYIVLI